MINGKSHIIFSILILLLMFFHINSAVARNNGNCTKERFFTSKHFSPSFKLIPHSPQQPHDSSGEKDLSTSDSDHEDISHDYSPGSKVALLYDFDEVSLILLANKNASIWYYCNYDGVELRQSTPPPRA